MDLFRNYVRQSGLYGKGTDIGTVLEKLCAIRPEVLNSATTLLVLSDCKTIDLPRATAAILEAKRRSGKMLWLDPIPERKWQYLRSSQTVAAICKMLPCSTLHELAEACRRSVL